MFKEVQGKEEKMLSVNNKSDYIPAMIEYIKENYNKKINLDTLCKMYGYSTRNFRRLFAEKTGKSPNDFLIELRIQKAIELLKTNRHTVVSAAKEVGYDDSNYFNRLFCKKTGFSPGNIKSTR